MAPGSEPTLHLYCEQESGDTMFERERTDGSLTSPKFARCNVVSRDLPSIFRGPSYALGSDSGNVRRGLVGWS